MQTIRSFISIPLSPLIKSGASKWIKKLSEFDEGVKWVPTDNFHLTLKFLGEVDNTEVHTVCQRLRIVAADYDPFELLFGAPGVMPNPRKPRIIMVNVHDSAGMLVPMVEEIEGEMADLGFRPEQRDYRPHLTIGRTRGQSRRTSEELINQIESMADFRLGEMIVDELQLMASFLDKKGPTYQVMDTIEL